MRARPSQTVSQPCADGCMIPAAMSLRIQVVPFFFFTTLSIFAQRPGIKPVSTMELCSVNLSIGMPKEKVIARLAEECKVTKVDNDANAEEWFLTDKSPKPKPVGILEFESNRLSKISRSCLPSDKSFDYGADGFARALVIAVNSLTDGRETVMTVRSAIKQDKDNSYYFLVLFLANGRQVEVNLMANASNGKTIMLDVNEAISK
jgi:hypothetical protein